MSCTGVGGDKSSRSRLKQSCLELNMLSEEEFDKRVRPERESFTVQMHPVLILAVMLAPDEV